MKCAMVAALTWVAAFVHASVPDLSTNKTWLRLLHFDEGHGRSRIVNPHFFLSPQGSTDPRAELDASIHLIRSESSTTPENERFACRFPARKRFLEKHLGPFPRVRCPSLEEVLKRSPPDSISLVFSSQFLGNPASVMGHTFLRFEGDGRSPLLGLTFSFYAKTDRSDNPFAYAYKGLFGGYAGVFEFGKFYRKSHLYGSVENRDLWDYKLRFNREERLFLIEHAHELSTNGQMNYYFLDRNCSLILMEFLEVARENLVLPVKFPEYSPATNCTIPVAVSSTL